MKLRLSICTICALCAICGLFSSAAFAQVTITLTPGTTYQTWKAFGSTAPDKWSDLASCVVISDALHNTMLNWLVLDLRPNRVRIPLNNNAARVNLPGDDGSGDPFVFANPSTLEPYATRLAATWAFGSCTRSYTMAAAAAKKFRDKVQASGTVAEMNLSQLNNGGFTSMPTEWKNGTNGVDYHSKAMHATVRWTHDTYGYWIDTFTVNEPDTASAWFTSGGGSAIYYSGAVLSMKNRFATAGIPTTWEGPNTVSGGATESTLAIIDDVANAKEALSRFSAHCYSCPDPTAAAAIAADAAAFGKETGMDEYYVSNVYTDDTFATGVSFMLGYFFPMLTNLNASMYDTLSYWFACPSTNAACDPTVGIYSDHGMAISNDGSTFYLNPLFYAWRQFTHYVRPGYVRISATTGTGNTAVTAWKRPDGTLVTVLINKTGSTQNVTFNGLHSTLHDIFRADATQCTTTGFARCTPTATTGTPSGGSLVLSIPNNAVWTLSERSAKFVY